MIVATLDARPQPDPRGGVITHFARPGPAWCPPTGTLVVRPRNLRCVADQIPAAADGRRTRDQARSAELTTPLGDISIVYGLTCNQSQ
ncbi:hypothetical protein Aau02nite_90550 [Amorphoplanes auranticolor]|uniref:Uncharacterized protein n=1 Tax=Actinoplanes auranticolor TaxID=47988 RepID=A0A919SXS0_9ACTN|nr:hypothetical protein Aau02nite_90550 [Actinoplanes auranticolor]